LPYFSCYVAALLAIPPPPILFVNMTDTGVAAVARRRTVVTRQAAHCR
jgi:hypothetical protein